MTKMLIDSDTGIDDAMGLLHLLRRAPGRVVGITTLTGNVHRDFCTANALRILDMLDLDVPVVPGAQVTLRGDAPISVPHVHGPEGHGYAEVSAPTREPLRVPATEFITQQVERHQGNLVIVAVGPLTNIANAIAARRDLFELARPRIVWMGGAVNISGNVSPVAEFNASTDPEAADLVLNSGLDVTMIPLDVTERPPGQRGSVCLDENDTETLRSSGDPSAEYMAAIAKRYVDFYANEVFGQRACPMHSGIAMMVAYDQTLVRSSIRAPVRVETRGEWTRGMTVTDRRHLRSYSTKPDPPRSITIVTDIDGARYKSDFLEPVDKVVVVTGETGQGGVSVR